MILVGQYDSPFVRRVGVALLHYGFSYEHRPWSVWVQADELAKLNPLRRVPVLVMDDGEILLESGAILDALDEMAPPERVLLPRSGPLRRAGLRICALATGLADKSISLFYEGVLHSESTRSAKWVDRCRAQLRDTLDVLESERAARPGDFFFESFSHADIAVACALRFTAEAHPSLLRARARPALAAHAAHFEAIDLFQRIAQPLDVQVTA
jgi:glutathione S-transferase